MYNAKRMYKEGMAHYNQALKANPNDPRIHHDLGMALLHQRQFNEAIKHLSEALGGMPHGLDKQYNPVGMHFNLALAFSFAERPKEAIAHFSEVVHLDPKNAPAHYRLAMSYAETQQFGEAVQSAKKALGLANAAGNVRLLQEINKLLEFCKNQGYSSR